ncbi:hypothetical protein MKZ38_009604 [Zalerion maritima]|uniref:Carbohydrate kinase PfkB domain-containing protein n=1 Tax=Zalerion maritima TaxID=339359 RepID=A0AAD5RGG9_9PEZI|nr:hypothetical protein MKZ38_009604 [Zalerion maritima]
MTLNQTTMTDPAPPGDSLPKAVDAVEIKSPREENAIADDQAIDFVTLGMFIIDDIDLPPPLPPVKNILGGAGTFAAIGARLFSPPPDSSRTVGWIIDQGHDFPSDMTTLIESWSSSAHLRSTPDRATTRGWNGYGTTFQDSNRAFKYMTPKKRLTGKDLCPALLASRTFHLICGPNRCRELVTEISSLRRKLPQDDLPKPMFVWEPVPDLCVPGELLNVTNVLPLVDICSPNHSELASLMGDETGFLLPSGEVNTTAVERSVEQLLASMPLQSYTMVVRCGGAGCYIGKNGGRKRTGGERKRRKKPTANLHGGLQPDTDMEALFAGLLQDEDGSVAREEIEVDPGIEKWFPAYHDDELVEGDGGWETETEDGGEDEDGEETSEILGDEEQTPMVERVNPWQLEGEPENGATKEEAGSKFKVVDPTGGGNTFMGAMAIALARAKNLEEAAVWGSVAASFAIEQVGLPVLGADEEGNETWNGVRVGDRLNEFLERVGMAPKVAI